MRRVATGVLLLGAATGGPYVILESPVGDQAAQMVGFTSVQDDEEGGEAPSSWASWWPAGTDDSTATTADAGWPSSVPSGNQELDASEEIEKSPFNYQRVQALREIVRFDVSPTWVTQRFQRVSTVLADMQLDGLRVTLMTGTTPTDLAGTLTYYFDRYQRVQRITIHAMTGDPSRFLAELQHAYQLQQQPSLGGGLFLKKWNGRPTSVVYTTLAPVVTKENPYARYQFFAELNQTALEYGLSNESQQLLASGKALERWQ